MDKLKIFLSVSAGGSMSLTAREFGLTQSAISQIVRQMEDRFGTVLIDRTMRPLRLTAAGNVLRRYAARILEEAEQMTAAIHSLGTAPELRIAMVDSFAGTLGPDFIRAATSHAHTLYVEEGSSSTNRQSFCERKVDILVSPDPLDDLENVERHPLLEEPFVVIAPASLPTRGQVPEPRTLARELPIICYNPRTYAGIQTEAFLRRHGVSLTRRIEVESSDLMSGLVAQGVGWAITTPIHLLLSQQLLPRLSVHLLPDDMKRRLFLITRKQEFLALSDVLRAEVARSVQHRLVPAIAQFAPAVARAVRSFQAMAPA